MTLIYFSNVILPMLTEYNILRCTIISKSVCIVTLSEVHVRHCVNFDCLRSFIAGFIFFKLHLPSKNGEYSVFSSNYWSTLSNICHTPSKMLGSVLEGNLLKCYLHLYSHFLSLRSVIFNYCANFNAVLMIMPSHGYEQQFSCSG